MDLNTIKTLERPSSAEAISRWREGYAWLAGGTWLYSEPQPKLDTLIDLEGLNWPSLEVSSAGLEIAATCRIEEIEKFRGSPEWIAAPLLPECSHSLLMSFKVAHEATVGGNICMSLPAGAMISLTAALEAVYTLWPRAGVPRKVLAIDFQPATTKTYWRQANCCARSISRRRHRAVRGQCREYHHSELSCSLDQRSLRMVARACPGP